MSDKEKIIKVSKQLGDGFLEVMNEVSSNNKDLDDAIVIASIHKTLRNMFQSACINCIKQMPLLNRPIGLKGMLMMIDEMKGNIEKSVGE